MWCLVRMLWIVWLAFLSLCACVSFPVLCYNWCSKTDTLTCVCMHAHTITHKCMQTTCSKIGSYLNPPCYSSTPPQHSVHLCKLLAVSCIDHVPPNPQAGRTPLLLVAGAGHLPVATLLVEMYHCDVNEEDGKVSGWEVMGGMSEYSICVSSHMWPSDTVS